jgi:hypothetical protein
MRRVEVSRIRSKTAAAGTTKLVIDPPGSLWAIVGVLVPPR